MKLAHALPPLLLVAVACGGKSQAPAAITHGGAAHVANDVDGDGTPDTATLADGVVTMGPYTFAIPADWHFYPAGAIVVELGTEAVVAIESEIVEDDLRWRILQFRDGGLHDVGEAFVGGTPDLPGDGTIHASTGNCGQSTALTYRIVDGTLAKDEQTTGTYDEAECAACPYVLVDSGDGWRFVGESLRNLVGPSRATEDALALPAISADTRELRVILEEVKPETTYLDAITVDFGGVRVAPRGCASGGSACAADGVPEVFTLGERRQFAFDVPAGFTGTPVLYARGYYQPFEPSVAR
ncbi:MAG: hypothetical protein R3B06_15845 [Kofleriaceae bacterium]